MKKLLLYMTLLILIVLLFLPPMLRLFGKDLYKERKFTTKQTNELEMLNCTKYNETISTSFLNGKAYNIKYEISGNHVPEKAKEEKSLEDEKELSDLLEEGILPDEEDTTTQDNTNKNTLVDDFKDVAEVSYVEEKNLTEFRIAVNTLGEIPESLKNHTRMIEEVKNYYIELSFTCTTQKY